MAKYVHHDNGWRTKVSEDNLWSYAVNIELQRHLFWKFWTNLDAWLLLPSIESERFNPNTLETQTVEEYIDGKIQAQIDNYINRTNQQAAVAAYFEE